MLSVRQLPRLIPERSRQPPASRSRWQPPVWPPSVASPLQALHKREPHSTWPSVPRFFTELVFSDPSMSRTSLLLFSGLFAYGLIPGWDVWLVYTFWQLCVAPP